ncbi:MAG TPA: phosphoglycolate phosphatase [Alphaproteobacteria bacterium]|jgi:phosphoglycolate phosphatase|nr:phosphoglycolate phosphatase [Alphaproteobacteria bacterium]
MAGRPTLLLFDLDGTLIDSVGDLSVAINRLLAELGRAPLEIAQVRPMIGDGVGKLVERALAASIGGPVDIETAVARYVALYEAAPADRTIVYPGVAETLAVLAGQGYRSVVCTNKPERLSRAVLGALGIDQYMAGVVGGDSLPWRKPDPRVIAATLERFGGAAGEALFVGDSEVDGACAESAGVPFALMTYGYHRVPLAEIPRLAALDNFADLPALLAGL